MLYPFKFNPIFKDYIWGGRNLKKLGKNIPEGITAESWEISCHPDGVSTISNGEFSGVRLDHLVEENTGLILGQDNQNRNSNSFPLMFKLIDAKEKLSVQVHPDDTYAMANENEAFGKNEMWCILDAVPGASIVYGTKPGTTRKSFKEAIDKNEIENSLNFMKVKPGDIIDIPAGLVHAIGEGIILAEIQQNSNLTYRVFDYNRIDKTGAKRQLHLDKALEVMNFDIPIESTDKKKTVYPIGLDSSKKVEIENPYFIIETYDLKGTSDETTGRSKFHIYYCIEGVGSIQYENGELEISIGDSILIPAALGDYKLKGNLKLLKAFTP